MKNKYTYYGSTGLVTLMLCASGFANLAGMEEAISNLTRVGIQNMALIRFIGFCHIAGGLGLWWPQTRTASYYGLCFLFTGATVAHFGAGDTFPMAFAPLLPFALLGFSYWSSSSKSGSSRKGYRKAA